jgi:hypothetical protein
MSMTTVINVEDADRGLVFTVDVTYEIDTDGTVNLLGCRPLRGYAVMPIIDHRERLGMGKDRTEEFEFKLPEDTGFRKRFRQDYEDVMLEVLDEQVTDARECASARVW